MYFETDVSKKNERYLKVITLSIQSRILIKFSNTVSHKGQMLPIFKSSMIEFFYSEMIEYTDLSDLYLDRSQSQLGSPTLLHSFRERERDIYV